MSTDVDDVPWDDKGIPFANLTEAHVAVWRGHRVGARFRRIIGKSHDPVARDPLVEPSGCVPPTAEIFTSFLEAPAVLKRSYAHFTDDYRQDFRTFEALRGQEWQAVREYTHIAIAKCIVTIV